MDINILIDKKRYKFSQLIAMQKNDLAVIRDVIAQNMTCPSGEYLEKEAAVAMLDELDGEQVEKLIAQFQEALEDIYEDAVPFETKKRLSRRSRMAGSSPFGQGS